MIREDATWFLKVLYGHCEGKGTLPPAYYQATMPLISEVLGTISFVTLNLYKAIVHERSWQEC